MQTPRVREAGIGKPNRGQILSRCLQTLLSAQVIYKPAQLFTEQQFCCQPGCFGQSPQSDAMAQFLIKSFHEIHPAQGCVTYLKDSWCGRQVADNHLDSVEEVSSHAIHFVDKADSGHAILVCLQVFKARNNTIIGCYCEWFQHKNSSVSRLPPLTISKHRVHIQCLLTSVRYAAGSCSPVSCHCLPILPLRQGMQVHSICWT